MEAAVVASVIVALISAGFGFAAQRAASKALKDSAEASAYTRAQSIDSKTIERLDKENKELREELKTVRARVTELEGEIAHYRKDEAEQL